MLTLAIGIPVCLALAVWVFIGTMRVHSDRARTLLEGMTPQRIVYRRLSREIHERHGR